MSGRLFGERALPERSGTSRRAFIALGAKLAGGGALAVLPVAGMPRGAAAQDDSVILVAGAAEIGASPGSAFARSAAAAAAAARGAARVQAAAALAEAERDDSAIAQSAVAFAAADPDQGAVAQSAIATASASSQDVDDGGLKAPAKAIEPARDGRRAGADARGGGRGTRRAMRAGGGRDRAGRQARVGRLPAAGIGAMENGPLATLFATASAAAGIGAALLRQRTEPVLAVHPLASDDEWQPNARIRTIGPQCGETGPA